MEGHGEGRMPLEVGGGAHFEVVLDRAGLLHLQTPPDELAEALAVFARDVAGEGLGEVVSALISEDQAAKLAAMEQDT